MTDVVISERLKEELMSFLKKEKKADLVTAYLYFLEKKFHLQPVLFAKEKMIFQSQEELIHKLEKEGRLWRETEIKIEIGQPSVNEQTKKIYICPFTGKVFGDNTHPNPQDAIYDWVANCPENTERHDGLKVKRFLTSEDPDMIKNYIGPKRAPIKKVVFSSAVTGKLFNSRQAVLEDFIKNQLKPMDLIEVPRQNRFQIEEKFLQFIQEHLDEGRIAAFVEAVSHIEEFAPYVDQWHEDAGESSG